MIRPILALAAGAALPLSMAPFGIWPLGFLSLAVLYALLVTEPRRGYLTGWLYGIGLYGVGVSWVYVSIHVHGHAPPLLAGFLVSLFVAGLALFPLLAGGLFVRFRSTIAWRSAAWFVIVVVTLEWLLTWFLTGFPWLAAGYGQLDSPLAGLAPVGGVALVSAALLVSAAGGVETVRTIASSRREPDAFPFNALAGWLLVAGLPWAAGALLGSVGWVEPGAVRTAALVQGNVPQEQKWHPDNRGPIIRHYRRLTEPHWGRDVILWPEAAITVFEHEAEALLAELDARGRASGTALVLGLPALEVNRGAAPGEPEIAFLNTARVLGEGEGRYVKRRLVPFGEYVPLEGILRGLIDFFDLPMSHARAGDPEQPPLYLHGRPAAMAICYEVVYGELVRSDVSVLLTLSNDTWFGDSIGPHQHLGIARMRALENGRWLLRATNNGITAIVTADGSVAARLPRNEAAVLTGTYREMEGRTPYNRFGSWPVYGTLLMLAVGLLATRGRGERARGP